MGGAGRLVRVGNLNPKTRRDFGREAIVANSTTLRLQVLVTSINPYRNKQRNDDERYLDKVISPSTGGEKGLLIRCHTTKIRILGAAAGAISPPQANGSWGRGERPKSSEKKFVSYLPNQGNR